MYWVDYVCSFYVDSRWDTTETFTGTGTTTTTTTTDVKDCVWLQSECNT